MKVCFYVLNSYGEIMKIIELALHL